MNKQQKTIIVDRSSIIEEKENGALSKMLTYLERAETRYLYIKTKNTKDMINKMVKK